MTNESDRLRFELPVDRAAYESLRERQMFEKPARAFADALVRLRHDPRRGALEQIEPRDAWLNLRHELNRARTGADHGDVLAFERIRVIPARGMKQLAFEALQSRDARHRRPRQRTARGDQYVGLDVLAHAAGIEFDLPHMTRFVEACRHHARIATHVTVHAILARAMLQISENFVLAAEGARPRRVRLERKRIQMRGHVALGARIGIVAPCPADV